MKNRKRKKEKQKIHAIDTKMVMKVQRKMGQKRSNLLNLNQWEIVPKLLTTPLDDTALLMINEFPVYRNHIKQSHFI